MNLQTNELKVDRQIEKENFLEKTNFKRSTKQIGEFTEKHKTP